jgi:ribosomal protein L14
LLDARLARCRGSSSIVDEYLPSLWLTPSPPTTVPSIPTAPAIASSVVAAILGPMGPEFQRLPRREDGRRVPPDDNTVVVLHRRRRRLAWATTTIIVATAIPKAPHRLVVRLQQEIRRPAGCDLACVGLVE